MTTILPILTARWFLTLVGALILVLLIWFGGPLLPVGDGYPLEGDGVRLVLVLIVLVAWGTLNLLALSRARRTEQTLVNGVTGISDADNDTGTGALKDKRSASGDAAEEIAILKGRLQESIDVLRKADPAGGRGKRFLYQLPWYMMIGPPGSGKSTALENSGLLRRVSDRKGRPAVRGVAGTRNCEWLFTEDAVLIDTAGRYTTQDSHEAVDSAAWTGFLDLLKTTRPRQPINGVIVAISLSDLATAPEAERKAHAQAVRRRLNELHGAFGVRFPTYLMLTKADLIAGFAEFFDDLDKTQREQVWGMTFPHDPEAPDDEPHHGFAAEFDRLVERLNALLLDRLQRETDVERRARIFGFPAQVALLKEPVEQFLTEVFELSRYEQKPLLRGVYLTSGTQEGTPFDRLTASIARMIGAEQHLLPNTGAGRAYFLTGLLRDLIFPESSLVSTNPAEERRALLRRRTAIAAVAAGVLCVLGAWTVSFLANQSLIAKAAEAADLFAQQIAAVPASADKPPQLEALLPPLDILRALTTRAGQPVPVSATFGLSQSGVVRNAAAETYRQELRALLLPALIYRLEGQIRQNQQNTDYAYEALKVYRMLGGQGPLERPFVRRWMEIDFGQQFTEKVSEPLLAHLDTLLESPLTLEPRNTESPVPMPLDTPLVVQTIRLLSRTPPAERAYAHLRRLPAAQKLPEWRIVDAAGPAGARVFARGSGKLLSEGIPGLYTREGFYTVLLPALKDIADEVAHESWVLEEPGGQGNAQPGAQPATQPAPQPTAQPTAGAAPPDRMQRNVLQLYVRDYIKRWDDLLADVALVPMPTMGAAAQVAGDLSGPASPLRNLLTAVAAQTKLAGAKGEAASSANAALAALGAAKVPGTDRLAKVVTTTTTVTAALPDPGHEVDEHFARLHAFVDGRSGVPGVSLDDVVRQFFDLNAQLTRMQSGGPSAGGSAPGGSTAVQQLTRAVANLPAPVAALAAQMGKAGSTATVGSTRAELNALWTAQVLPFCRQATENRYPVYRSGAADVPLADFAKLFGPGGQLDVFFNQHLLPYVDMTRLPWQWQKVDGADLGISASVLVQFQRAAIIRDAFFDHGSGPMVSFELVPTALDPASAQVTVEIDGQPVALAPGQSRPIPVRWPGSIAQTRITVSNAPSPAILIDGPWSWFRLLDRARVGIAGSRDRLTATLAAGGATLGFELRARSVLNPFALKELAEFRCPGSL